MVYKHKNDSTEYAHILDANGVPCGSVRIASLPEGTEILPAAPVVRNIQAEIDALERAAMMPRGTREKSMLDMMKEAAILTFGVVEFYTMTKTDQEFAMIGQIPTLYTTNIGFKKLKDLDDEIKALRAQL